MLGTLMLALEWYNDYARTDYSRNEANWTELSTEELRDMNPFDIQDAFLKPVIKLEMYNQFAYVTPLRACKTFFTFKRIAKPARDTNKLYRATYNQLETGEAKMYTLKLPERRPSTA